MDKLETILTGAMYKGPENAKLINLAEVRIARPDPCVSLPCTRSVSMLAALSLSGQSFLCREASPSATRMFYSQLWVHTPPLPGGTHPVGTPLPHWSRVPSVGVTGLHAGGALALLPAHNRPSLHLIFLEMPAKAPSSLARDCVL